MARKVLLTDPSPEVKKAVKVALEPKGFKVFFKSNADHVIRKAQSIYPDVIILGSYFSNGDVYEVCRAIKEDPEIRHIPVIVLTDDGEGYDVFRAKEFGVDEHICKPFQGKDLVNKVSALIDIDADTIRIERADIDARDVEEEGEEGKSGQGDLDSMNEDTLELTDEIESFEADNKAPGFPLDQEGEVSLEQQNRNSPTLEITEMEDSSFDEELEEGSGGMIGELPPGGDLEEIPEQLSESAIEEIPSFPESLTDTHEEKREVSFGEVLKGLEEDDLAPSIPPVGVEEISGALDQVEGQEVSLESVRTLERGQRIEPTPVNFGLVDLFLEGEIRKILTNKIHELSQKILAEMAPPIIERVARDVALECIKKMAGLNNQPRGRGGVPR
jgi:DNA-binding response OmpR family regulator